MEMGETAVAVAATNLIGPTFAGIIYVFVTISVMGTVNGVILGYIRLPYSLALRNAIPSPFLEKINSAQHACQFRFLCNCSLRVCG